MFDHVWGLIYAIHSICSILSAIWISFVLLEIYMPIIFHFRIATTIDITSIWMTLHFYRHASLICLHFVFFSRFILITSINSRSSVFWFLNSLPSNSIKIPCKHRFGNKRVIHSRFFCVCIYSCNYLLQLHDFEHVVLYASQIITCNV